MQFQTPQFINIENKIVGPLSLRQFFYLAGASAFSFIFYFTLTTGLWFMLTAFLGAISIALAFVKYNGQPLPKILFAMFGFFWKPKLYLWQRVSEEKTFSIETRRKNLQELFSEMPSVKKLYQDLMTTKNPIPKREKRASPSINFQMFRKLTGEKEIAKRVDYR